MSSDEESHDGRSPLAAELAELRRSLFDAVASRERVPQPLFWSLLHSRLNDIRREKELQRLLTGVLDKE